VRTQVKGDLTCASVAAASVLAKVNRDAQMAALDERFPAYGWSGNKGYGAPGHQQAIRELGVTEFHRVSWNIQ
jgi:ribonuclease HII